MDKKSTQLGMHYSTAMARLDRQVLFMVVQKAGLDTCHRCGKKITRWQDLSLEHIKDWQDVDPELFWDLENLAFSHKSCNYRAGSIGKVPANDRTQNAPEGQSWCAGHKTYHPIDAFRKNAWKKSGRHHYCRELQ